MREVFLVLETSSFVLFFSFLDWLQRGRKWFVFGIVILACMGFENAGFLGGFAGEGDLMGRVFGLVHLSSYDVGRIPELSFLFGIVGN